MAEPYSLVVEEITGAGRYIALSGRAIPHQKQSIGGVKQRYKQTWYGNPQATIAALGPELPDTKLDGEWNDRYLSGCIEMRGFDIQGVPTAQTLVEAFSDICLTANRVRVSIGPMTRQGIIGEFLPTYTRTEDIAWEMTFVWDSERYQAPRGSVVNTGQTDTTRRAMDSVDKELASVPRTVDPRFYDDAATSNNVVRTAYVTYQGALASATASIDPPVLQVQGMRTDADAARTVILETAKQMTALPYTKAQPVDDVTSVIRMEVWRRNYAAAQRMLAIKMLKAALQKNAEFAPTRNIQVTVGFGQTLRHIAKRYYGDPDQWVYLADVNRLSSSIVPVGSTVLVPVQSPALGQSQGT